MNTSDQDIDLRRVTFSIFQDAADSEKKPDVGKNSSGKVIVVTSPVSGEGVTYVAMQMCKELSRDPKRRTLYCTIDALSHILSYTRLVGILLASVILALVANGIAVGSDSRSGLIFSGTAFGVVFGLLILLMVQVFNVVLGVFEPGIQGARLIFVEHFSKFYTGNGRPFTPFATARRATQSAHVPPPPPT